MTLLQKWMFSLCCGVLIPVVVLAALLRESAEKGPFGAQLGERVALPASAATGAPELPPQERSVSSDEGLDEGFDEGLAATARVSGIIVDSVGRPVSEGSFWLGVGRGTAVTAERRVITDAGGGFELLLAPREVEGAEFVFVGIERVVPAKPKWGHRDNPSPRVRVAVASKLELSLGEVRIPQLGDYLTGRVIAASGEGVGNARVQFTCGEVVVRLRCDTDGYFWWTSEFRSDVFRNDAFESDAPVELSATVSKRGFKTQSVDLRCWEGQQLVLTP